MALIDAFKTGVSKTSSRRTPTKLGSRTSYQGQPPPQQERPGKEGRSYGADMAAQARAEKVAQTPGAFYQQFLDVMRNTGLQNTVQNIQSRLGNIHFGAGLPQMPAGSLGQAQGIGTQLYNQANPPPATLTHPEGEGGRWAAWEKQNLTPQEWRALQADYAAQVNRWEDEYGNIYIRELDYANPGNFLLSVIPAAAPPNNDQGDGGYVGGGGGGGGGGSDYLNNWRANLLSWTGL